MILYDENYKFLGASNKELNRFGFSDITEFDSYHKDFAELFVKDDDYIYDFENFSWIDFILYGGANKDTAIIQNKAKEYKKVKIKIITVELTNNFCDIEKLYRVKLEDLGELSKEEETKITNTKINLSSMLTKSKDLKEDKKQNDLDINLSFMENEDIKDDDKSSINSISLDFLKKEKTKEEKPKAPLISKKEDEIKETNSNIVLDFFNSKVEDETPVTSISKKEEPLKEKESKSEFNLNFLGKKEDNQDKKVVEEEPKKSTFNLNFLNSNEDQNISQPQEEKPKVETPTPKKEEVPSLNLNFLKTEEVSQPKEEIKPEVKEEQKPEINLNFLKTEEESKPKKEIQQEIKEQSKPEINLNFLKSKDTHKEKTKELSKEEKSTIIDQIKNDIEEIDDKVENSLFLKNIDLPIEEKKDILNDFIDDSMQSLSLAKKFISHDDFDSTKFMIKKVLSSSNLLELDTVSQNLNLLAKSIDSKNKEDIEGNIQKSINSINNLKKIKI